METFSIKEISENIKIGESTLRFWRDRYEKFIPVVGKGRKRKYPVEGVEVIKLIAEFSRQGLNKIEIEEKLSDDNAVKTIKTTITAEKEDEKIIKEVEKIIKDSVEPVFKELLFKINNLEKLINNLESKNQENKNQQQTQRKQQEKQLKQQQPQQEKSTLSIIEKDKILFDVVAKFPDDRQECADYLNSKNIICGRGGQWTRKKVTSNLNHAKKRAKNQH